jgi:hypothetical protein
LSIVFLNLSNNDLKSIAGIGSLANLTSLNVSGNSLDYLPDDLCNCQKLAKLDASDNLLTFRSFPLKLNSFDFDFLDISSNRIEAISPEFSQMLIRSLDFRIHSNDWKNALIDVTGTFERTDIIDLLLKEYPSTSSNRSSTTSEPPRRQSIFNKIKRKMSFARPPEPKPMDSIIGSNHELPLNVVKAPVTQICEAEVASPETQAPEPAVPHVTLVKKTRAAGPKGRKLPSVAFIEGKVPPPPERTQQLPESILS